jgi:hypothetical protein
MQKGEEGHVYNIGEKKEKPPNVEVARRKKSGSPIMCPTGASTTFALYHQQQEVA